MDELVLAVTFFFLGAAAAGVWTTVRHRDVDRIDDARCSVLPGSEGTMTVSVANPAREPVVVTACAYTARGLRRWRRGQLRRDQNKYERRLGHRTVRQLLGSVPAGGAATWTVIGDATSQPVCRVVLSVYQQGGRVRVHESVVRNDRDPIPSRPFGRVLARGHPGGGHPGGGR